MGLDGIRFLMRVVELGSVQRAAHVIGMSRSSLRRKLDNIEAQVGTALFVHAAAGIVLTPSGAIVVEQGRALLERCEDMMAAARTAAA